MVTRFPFISSDIYMIRKSLNKDIMMERMFSDLDPFVGMTITWTDINNTSNSS